MTEWPLRKENDVINDGYRRDNAQTFPQRPCPILNETGDSIRYGQKAM